MYHLRLKGSHYEAGFKRGMIFKKNGVTFPIKLDEFQLSYGKEAGLELLKYFPKGYEEIKGITDALKIDHETFLSWMMCMGCCMYNLEYNIPEIRGCTAFAYTHQGKTYYGRNNDLPPYLEKGSKAELYNLDNTTKFYITTSSFVNGEEGLNEYGFAVAMTFVATALHDINPGLNSVFIVRYLLEKAKTTHEAITLLYKIPIASNCNILLADKSGDIAVAELSPNKIHIRNPLIDSQGNKYISTTNEFTSIEMKHLESKDETFNSTLRYEVSMNALSNLKEHDDSIKYIKELLKGNLGFMCQYNKKDNFKTVWSSIFELNTLLIHRAEGDPRRNKIKMDLRLSKLVNKDIFEV